jgi:hypothetical protein
MSGTTTAERQRHTSANPCRICGGYDGMPRSHGERCHGYLRGDIDYCSREEHAGGLVLHEGSIRMLPSPACR